MGPVEWLSGAVHVTVTLVAFLCVTRRFCGAPGTVVKEKQQ